VVDAAHDARGFGVEVGDSCHASCKSSSLYSRTIDVVPIRSIHASVIAPRSCFAVLSNRVLVVYKRCSHVRAKLRFAHCEMETVGPPCLLINVCGLPAGMNSKSPGRAVVTHGAAAAKRGQFGISTSISA
jgi:hypothetical protein